MRFDYDPETDSLYIKLLDRPSVDTEEVAEDVMVDFDAQRQVVGFDIQHASRFDVQGLLAEILGKAS